MAKDDNKEIKGPPIRTGDPRVKKEQAEIFPNKAFGMIRLSDKDGGKWKVVTLSFDLESNKAVIDLVEEFEGKLFAFNKFKTKVASEF